MPAFTQRLRRVSNEFKAKLPLRKQSSGSKNSVFETMDEEFDAIYEQSNTHRVSFPDRLARPSAADYGVLRRVPTDCFALKTPPLSPDYSPQYSACEGSLERRTGRRRSLLAPVSDVSTVRDIALRREDTSLDVAEGIQVNAEIEIPSYAEASVVLPSRWVAQLPQPSSRSVSFETRPDERPPIFPAQRAHNTSPQAALDSKLDAKTDLERLVAHLPAELWVNVARFLKPSAAASFAVANRQTARLVGGEFWATLNSPKNKPEKISFLQHLDDRMPDHLLCFECAIYHRRRDPGNECLRESYRQKPMIKCMRQVFVPQVRLSLDRSLPFPLAQLAMRAHRLGPSHGIPLKALNRSWQPLLSDWTTTTEWTHQTRFVVDRDQLLMKVTSRHFVRAGRAKSEQILALTCRKDYTANYSTCAHVAHSLNLFAICKCALKHIPPGDAPRMPSSCATCRPLTRCIACPTEFLVEARLKEDKTAGGPPHFHPAIIVSRWTNLGDCRSPGSKEWRACSSLQDLTDDDDFELYRADDPRTVRSRFEAASGARPSEVRARPLRRFSSAGDHRERELMRDDGRRMAMFMRGY